MNRVKTTLLAAISIALAFTFSCSGDDGGSSSSGTFKDSRDGKTYKWVKIGDQTWMAENLNFEGSSAYFQASSTACYNNNSSNCDAYGRLYNWHAALNACPPGWHLPTDAEWTVLTDFVGTDPGTKLKAASGWNSGGNGTDEFGFSALPGGGGWDGSFARVGSEGFWWSATGFNTSDAWYWSMSMSRSNKLGLNSVRCVKN
ncbi:MAG: fibrobacter succinogenes major paralogous domain-containing protein [Fibromonadaceae bacterium]|jgi:uncharacterized protein (TIGR02145 family)|nr:fibrobacter succinogenes major paralogous domain-containing protein [Fibromonadaceae bacterium]